jgi:hypothetical protein
MTASQGSLRIGDGFFAAGGPRGKHAALKRQRACGVAASYFFGAVTSVISEASM